VRNFILEVLRRLACRDDVAGIVLNTHSNGTLIGIDVQQELPTFVAAKIRAMITAGSPISKYVNLFSWGKHLEVTPKLDVWLDQWTNFYDENDIVADPLQDVYQSIDTNTGDTGPITIHDIKVENTRFSNPPGDMPAHNYWDNQEQFIPQVAAILKTMI